MTASTIGKVEIELELGSRTRVITVTQVTRGAFDKAMLMLGDKFASTVLVEYNDGNAIGFPKAKIVKMDFVKA